MPSVVVLDHIFCWNTKTFKIPTKLDIDATDDVMGLNKNYQEPGGINKYVDVTDDQEPKEISTNTNVTDSDTDADTDADMGLNVDTILKQIKVITGTLYDPSALTSGTVGTQYAPSTLTSITGDSNKSSNVTADKGHRKNLFTISILRKDPIHLR